MHSLFCLDSSATINFDRRQIRDLILSIDRSLFHKDQIGSKLRYEPRYHIAHFNDLYNDSEPLRIILAYFYSQEWLDTIYPFILNSKRAFDKLQGITGFSKSDFNSIQHDDLAPFISSDMKRGGNLNTLSIYPNIQFSILLPGSSIPIHLDRSDKIASLMIYLPDAVQENHPKLGTSFWFPKSSSFNPPSTYSHESYRFFRSNEEAYIMNNSLEYPIPFSSACIFLFTSNNRSYHSISYPSNFDLGPRVSININYYACQ